MSETNEIRLAREEAVAAIDLRKAMDRLRQNPDFVRIIEEGYFREEAIRLVHLKNTFGMRGEEQQDSLMKQLDAIGMVREYLRSIYATAQASESALEEANVAMAEED